MILFSAYLSDKHQNRLRGQFPDVSFKFCKQMEEAKLFLSEAEILVTYGEDLDASLIRQATSLQWIMVLSAGIDQMPLNEIQKRNILVTNSRGIHKIPMAEYVISMLLQVYRQEKVLIQNENACAWDRSVRMQEISGKTMLIAGTGAIGQEVARLAKAFRMKTIGVSRSGREVDYFDETYPITKLTQVLSDVDFVVSVLPSTKETKYLFTYEHFKLLPNHAVFLNMGRGDVVASDVILKAIREEEIAHAVLDVFEKEPLPEDHPFWKEEKITITPHLSGLSPLYLTRALEIFKKNLHVYLKNESQFINKIELTKGY